MRNVMQQMKAKVKKITIQSDKFPTPYKQVSNSFPGETLSSKDLKENSLWKWCLPSLRP